MSGPVQVLVVEFDEPSFSGEVIAEFTRLREAGTVRLVDVLLVRRHQDGTFDTLPPPPGADPALGQVATDILDELVVAVVQIHADIIFTCAANIGSLCYDSNFFARTPRQK